MIQSPDFVGVGIPVKMYTAGFGEQRERASARRRAVITRIPGMHVTVVTSGAVVYRSGSVRRLRAPVFQTG